MAPLTPGDGDARMLNAELCYAIADGALEAVEEALKKRADVNLSDYEGRTPLHVAAGAHAGEAIVLRLLDLRASPEASDASAATPVTPLDRARQVGNTGFVDLISQRLCLPSKDRTEDSLELKVQGDGAAGPDFLQHGEKEHWAFNHDEVTLGTSLGSTLKSEVFTGEWRGTEVAVKRIKMHAGNDDGKLSEDDVELQRELLNEVRILSKLRHPDLVLFLGACIEKAPFMLLMELMPGGDLQRFYINKRKDSGSIYRPPVAKALQWLSSVARGLCFLHESHTPIIHRDLKPLNLLLTRTEDLKVTDFGISRAVSRATHGGTRVERAMTKGVGTYLYMAPEVLRTNSYDAKADIYSFALIMYYITSGYEPFHGDFKSSEDILRSYLDGQSPRPRAAECPSWVRQVMKDSWADDPLERPSAYELTHIFAGIHSPTTCSCSIS